MEKEIKICLIVALTALALASCKKFVDVPVPKDRVIASGVFTTDAKALSALTAVYGAMINGSFSFANGFTTLYAGLSSDELQAFAASASDAEIEANNISPTNPAMSSLWKYAYQYIYYANSLIEGVNNSAALSPSTKKQIIGECKFIRGFSYFYLSRFFGDVPLVTSTDYRENTSLGRTSQQAVRSFLLQDLQDAKSLLSTNYPTGDKTRPNKFAVQALLARVYLYNEEWGKAETEASDIINSGMYLPLQDPTSVFLAGSREAIWQLAPARPFMNETQLFFAFGGVPGYFLSPSVVEGFEPGDLRKSSWTDSLFFSGSSYFVPSKYKCIGPAIDEYYTVFRVAEVILIRAEARMRQNNLEGALDDINIIRQRASLAPVLTNLDQPQVIAAIEQERKSELFAEWGHRWFDLIRWHKTTPVLSPIKPGWKESAIRFPVPLDEILANPSLTQNPGY